MDLLNLHARWPQRYPALFESAASAGSSVSGRYDILFAHPQAVLWKDREGRLHGEGVAPHGESFLAAFDRWWEEARAPSAEAALPFTGGWLIFLGYEIAMEAEPSLHLPPPPESVAAFAMRVPAAVVFDRVEQRLQIMVEPGYEELIDEIERDLALITSDAATDATLTGDAIRSPQEDAPEMYLSAVRRAQELIAAGDIYQANLSRLWRAQIAPTVTPAQVYRRLRTTNPAPFSASVVWKDFVLLSSSPERLCELRGGEISTRPIAGTRPRSRKPGADEQEISGLIAHPKERAEHIMLIDLERNDLGRICEPGSVRVDEFMVLESYEHVHHIVSNVRGRLRAGVKPGEILRALFPGGTITGCPKVRCMQIIAELEAAGRGAYTGSLGYLNRDGSGDFNILIRTMTMQNGELRFRAGAGIVADSDPRRELEETRAKAEGLLRALRPQP